MEHNRHFGIQMYLDSEYKSMFLKKCFFKLELKYAFLFADMDVCKQHILTLCHSK